jgi:hypothetical protein
MRFIYFIISVVLSTTLVSCETIVDEIDLSQFPELKEKIVVTSFISPNDDSVIVRVSRSVPILSNIKQQFVTIYNENIQDSIMILKDSKIIEDAKVVLSDGKSSTILKFNPTSFYYSTTNFKIMAGKTYKLTVEALNQTVEATTTVPIHKTPIEKLSIEKYFEVTNSFFGKDTAQGFTLNFEWKDIADVNNYYKVWGELKYQSEVPTGKRDSLVYKIRTSYGYLDLNNDFSGDSRYFVDLAKDGQYFKVLNARLLFRDSFSCFGNNFDRDCFPHRIIENSAQNFTIEVSNITMELYEYQKSLRNFNRTADNPFAEPSPVYSNIKNGLGIFAAFNSTVIKENLK